MSYPYTSPRLTYRAIRPLDTLLFNLIASDTLGYQNSSVSNIHIPTSTDSADFLSYCATKCLLGVVIWLPHPPSLSAQDIAGKIAEGKNDGKEGLVETWGTAIGEIHLSRLPPDHVHHRFTEIGLDILPAYQGQGYGSEAILWALDYAFRLAGLHRVKIRALGWNAGAVRLYERLGFVVEGRERQAYWHEGRWWDGVDFGMLEGEWREMERMRRLREEDDGKGK
jgi:RimJ/RimL family protein N-acetyltransferase